MKISADGELIYYMNTHLYYEITCRRVQQSETDISRVWLNTSIANFNGFEGAPTEIPGVPKIAVAGME